MYSPTIKSKYMNQSNKQFYDSWKLKHLVPIINTIIQ